MENKLVCIVGMCGAGKSVVSDIFVGSGYKYIRFGQYTLDEIKRQGLEVNEKNEKMIREGLRKKHGMAAYAIINMPKIEEYLNQGYNVVADGLYSWSEYKVLKEKYGDNLIVIAVYASPKIRYQRLEKRKLEKNDKKMRNRPFSLEEAQSRDYADIENIEKGGPIAMADYTFINEGTIEELRQNVEKFINLWKLA